MGTFTVTLQEAIELSEPMERYTSIGLDAYPLFDPDYREALNEKIIAHFNEQEIGHETISMFRYAMARRMNEIMPFINQHYKASAIEIDPLKTVDIKSLGTSLEESTTESKSKADGRVVGSNTPQVRLSGNGDYATSAQDSASETTADGTAAQNASNENSTSGYQGNPAELVYALRQSFVNVDMMVIDSLNDLFMMIWDNGEEYTRGHGIDYYTGFYPFYW